MSIERKTVVDQIEIARNGTVQIRMGLLLVEDGVEIDCKWHRTVIEPDTDIDRTFAMVNEHLAMMSCKPVSVEDIDRVKEHAAFTFATQIKGE